MTEHQELIQKADKFVSAAQEDVNPRWYPQVHLAPAAGWINDPNSISYFKGRYHAFFQHHPYSAQWGPMHWGHFSSEDLVTWKREPIALAPSEEYDLDGVWSGCALEHQGKLYVFYTGNRWANGKDDGDGSIQRQCLAVSSDGQTFIKHGPVIESPQGISNFRDPKVWKQGEKWWLVIGVETPERRGQVWLYSSADLSTWDFDRVIYEDPDSDAFMIECPDFFEVDGKWVLVYSPMTSVRRQGYNQRNGHSTGYAVGNWTPGGDFEVLKSFAQFDFGHNFYATQSMHSPDNRRLMFGWMGGFTLPLASQAEDGWSGQLATPREVSLSKDLEIIATPIPEFKGLREDTVDKGTFTVDTDSTVELASDLPVGEIELTVDLDKTTSEQVSLLVQQTSTDRYTEVAYDSLSNRVILDRGKSGSTDRGYRSAPYVGGSQLKLRVIIDRGSLEVFMNDGRYSLSSLAFPAEGKRGVSIASVGGVIAVSDLKIHSLKSIWGN